MKISEASQQSGLSADTLRYYEKIGLLPLIHRTASGIRNFNELDIQRIKFIKYMRNAGLPIEVLIEYFALLEQGIETVDARKEILVEQRANLLARMAELQETLDLLNQKIDGYEDAILKKEENLVTACL